MMFLSKRAGACAVTVMVVLMANVQGVPSLAQRAKCGVDGYNVKALRKDENEKPYLAKSPHSHYHYYFNFCGHAQGCNQQPACQVHLRDNTEEIQTTTTIGELYSMKWSKLESKDFADLKSKGLDYKDGLKMDYSIGPMQRSVTIMVPCVEDDGNSDSKQEESTAGFVIEKPTLHYTVVFPSRHGCPVPVSQLPISLGGKDGAKSHHVFGFLLMVGTIAYCCVGAWYKRERLGAQGMEMIPHIDTMCAMYECIKSSVSGEGEGAMSGMFNRARGVGDDGL